MVQWRSGLELEQMFLVSPSRLAAYAARGNLAARRTPNGAWLYDEANVARLFRRRAVDGAHLPGQDLGKLGSARLGPAREQADERLAL